MKNVDVEEKLLQQCHSAADMVVDALMMAGLLKETDAEQAVGIVTEELSVRKAMNKL